MHRCKIILNRHNEYDIYYPNSMKNNSKILVAYASMYGTTAEVAKVIAETLQKESINIIVEAKPIKEIKNLEEYTAVIVGAPIRFDRWMSDAQMFVKNNKEILRTIPVAFFFTCMTLSQKSEKSERGAKIYSDALYVLDPEIKPISVQGFAGAVDYSKISFFLRYILKIALFIKGAKPGDYRNWEEIKNWAKSLASKMT